MNYSQQATNALAYYALWEITIVKSFLQPVPEDKESCITIYLFKLPRHNPIKVTLAQLTMPSWHERDKLCPKTAPVKYHTVAKKIPLKFV